VSVFDRLSLYYARETRAGGTDGERENSQPQDVEKGEGILKRSDDVMADYNFHPCKSGFHIHFAWMAVIFCPRCG
jgi:hypothetical protein